MNIILDEHAGRVHVSVVEDDEGLQLVHIKHSAGYSVIPEDPRINYSRERMVAVHRFLDPDCPCLAGEVVQ